MNEIYCEQFEFTMEVLLPANGIERSPDEVILLRGPAGVKGTIDA